MATVATYTNTNPDIGIYGLYNPFAVIISNDGTARENLTFRIRVSIDGIADTEVIRNVTPIGQAVVVEPFKLLQDTFFKSNFDFLSLSPNSFNIVKIEVGQTSSATAIVPPTFQGYVSAQEKSFYVYNGYENQPVAINYRDFYWYNFEPIKLPKIKQDISLLTNDGENLSYPNQFRGFYDSTDSIVTATNVITTFHRLNGSEITGTATDVEIAEPTAIGYARQQLNLLDASIPAAASSWKILIRYTNEEEVTFDSEIITVRRQACNPKQSNHRLYWVNRYGGDEYQNFTMLSEQSLNISKGKRIQSDGINYKATTFTDIQNINNPNIQEFGNSATKNIVLRSDYLSQIEVDALAELYKSAIVVMFDDDGTHPMVVTTSSYRIVSVQQELYKVEVNLQYANNELMQIQ
ncbi:hypothetical protein N9515_09990 [Vicingaceae bacterium]|nr:hypothetical protein [Vicingaceae bacterium]